MAILSFFVRTSRHRLLAAAWLTGLGLAAVLAPVLPLPYAPGTPDLAHLAEGPAAASCHWLGTDALGRDVLSNLLFGARTALLLTLPTVLLTAVAGGLAGGAAGFWGNRLRINVAGAALAVAAAAATVSNSWVVFATGAGVSIALWLGARMAHRPPTLPLPLDSLVLGAATGFDTVPRLVLVLALVTRGELSAVWLGLVLGLTSWAGPARLVRARMLAVRELPFVEAARATGSSSGRVWWRHALPHALQPLQTTVPLSMAGLLGLESTLSFLGVGLPPEVASWGHQLATARLAPNAWWVMLFPAFTLATTMLSLHAFASHRQLLAPQSYR